jgi:hypothetical protein
MSPSWMCNCAAANTRVPHDAKPVTLLFSKCECVTIFYKTYVWEKI